MRWLLLFVVLPAVELGLLIELGGRIGSLATLGVIAMTGLVGAALARSQGLRALGEVQSELEAGRLPTSSVVDGVLILLAAALLVTPGVLTDAFGFLCLVPAFRGVLKRELVRRFRKAVDEDRVQVHIHPDPLGQPDPTGQGFGRAEIDVTERGEDSRKGPTLH